MTPADVSEAEYEAVEAAVMETPRGRWFLAEYGKRHRVAETQKLLSALDKIENSLGVKAADPDIGPLVQAIRQTRGEIAAVRNHMLDDGGALADGETIYANIAEAAKAAASELMGRAQSLQTAAGLLKADGADTSMLDAETAGLQTLAWRQDVLSQRTHKAMALLGHLASNLEAISAPAPQGLPKLQPRQLERFKRDEDVFAQEPVIIRHVDAPPAVPIPDKPRIVVMRRPSGEVPPIPLEGGSAA